MWTQHLTLTEKKMILVTLIHVMIPRATFDSDLEI